MHMPVGIERRRYVLATVVVIIIDEHLGTQYLSVVVYLSIKNALLFEGKGSHASTEHVGLMNDLQPVVLVKPDHGTDWVKRSEGRDPPEIVREEHLLVDNLRAVQELLLVLKSVVVRSVGRVYKVAVIMGVAYESRHRRKGGLGLGFLDDLVHIHHPEATREPLPERTDVQNEEGPGNDVPSYGGGTEEADHSGWLETP